MKRWTSARDALVFAFAFAFACLTANAQTDPLPSWSDGAAKKAIVDFVQGTTTQGSPQFVAPEARIATFDQDGTLWVEHPMYSQVIYCLDRVPALVKAKPELAKVEPFKTVMSGNLEAVAKLMLHDDSDREYSYGPAKGLPATRVGAFTQALYDEASNKGWIVVSMRNDWRRVFAFEPSNICPRDRHESLPASLLRQSAT